MSPRGLHDTGIATGAAGEQILGPMSAPPVWRSLWPLRVIWLSLPLLVGPALADALAVHSRPVQIVGSVLAWAIWGATLGAMLVPRTTTLTAVRLAVPGAFVVAAWAAIGADRPGWAAVGIAAGAVAVLALAGPGVADGFVDGSSYGAERRVALRVPFAVLVGPAPLAWAAAAAGVVTPPLLLAAEQWVFGVLALAAGVPVVAVVARQMHLLSRRWLVFVPAGVVVHDPLTLVEPILLQRHLLARMGPALADAADDAAAIDTTGGALGLALELRASEPFSVELRHGRDKEEREDVIGMLVTPTQPATTLTIAADHHLPVA